MELKRHHIIWLSLYVAMITSVMFGLAQEYLGALICIWYVLAIVVLNLIDEFRKK